MEKTLKELLDNYYLIPKDIDFQDGIYCSQHEAEQVLQELSANEAYEEERPLQHACIVNRKVNKKLTDKQVKQIMDDNRSYRQLAKDYSISITTISKIKNNKY